MIMKNEKSKKWVRMLAVTVTLALAVTGTAAAYAATAGDTANTPVPAERGKDHNLVFAQPVQVGKNIPKEGPSTSIMDPGNATRLCRG